MSENHPDRSHTTEGKLLDERDDLLKPGAFYWILPAHDVDTDEPWRNKLQPARFVRYDGYTDIWIMLGLDSERDDAADWVGSEIIPNPDWPESWKPA